MKFRLYTALVALAVVTAACGTSQSDTAESSSTTQPTATTEIVTTSTSETSVEPETVPLDQALAASAAYFAAFNNGDADAVMALLPLSARFSDSFTGISPREVWEQRLVWNMAQGTTLAAPECTAAEGAPGEQVTVTCETATHNAEIQAASAPPVPTVVTIVITPNGIQDLRERFGQPDFSHASDPFIRWMQNNHPDDVDKIAFGNWDSIEEAQQNGELTAQYAQEWATYLEANNCTYLDGC